MITHAMVALKLINWKIEYDKKTILLGSLIGFTGAGGQLTLFHGLSIGPAYIIFPIIALSPVITVLLSLVILKEKTNVKGWIGILFAVIAIPFLSYITPDSTTLVGYMCMFFVVYVFLFCGV